MILEAFSEFLHSVPELPANQALSLWLWQTLKRPPACAVDQVIHCEVGVALGSGRHGASNSPMLNRGRKIRIPQEAESAIKAQISAASTEASGQSSIDSSSQSNAAFGSEPNTETIYFFEGASGSGVRLLNSLYEYAMSYEQQKWSRFVHKVKASDFKVPGEP